MKRATLFNLSVAVFLLATTATGCKKNPKNITTLGSTRNGGIQGDGMAAPIDPNANRIPEGSLRGNGLTPGDLAQGMENANEDRATLSPQTIYFDFAGSAIKTSEQGKLDQVATYLKSAPPGEQLKMEGNCDERGTEEYNRSLGERRAIAARDYLIQKHGIESGRLTTVSNGEDKPVELGKTEEAYAKNRRVEFVILKPR